MGTREEEESRKTHELLAQWRTIASSQGDRSDAWGLDALRNLAFLNGAGLAGAMTASQSGTIQQNIFWPATAFLSGIAAACLAIVLGWAMHRLAAHRYLKNHATFQASKNLEDLFRQNMTLLNAINGLSIASGVISFACFFYGAIKLMSAFF